MVAALRISGSSIVGIPAPLPSKLLEGVTQGPLVLWEPGNPNNYYTGLPADGATMPNLAKTWAQTTIGADPGDLIVSNGITAGSAKAKLERTTKGGLHVMQSQLNQDTTYQQFRIQMAANLLAYINSRPNDSWYLGCWMTKTRQFASGYTGSHSIFGLTRASGDPNFAAADRWLTAGPNSTSSHYTIGPATGDARLLGSLANDVALAGLKMFVSVGANAQPASWTTAVSDLIFAGPRISSNVNKFPSVILYRVYLENLTASGRSFNTVATIDSNEYTNQMLSVPGYYYNDANSTPSAVLP